MKILKAKRCGICGALVYGECYECYLKGKKVRGKLRKVFDLSRGDGKGLLDLDLSDDEERRLLEVRERAITQKEEEQE